MTAALPRPGSVGAWVLACRPATLTAAASPVLVGTAVASVSGGVRPGPAAAALAGAMLLQIASNLANDVFDHEKGADGADRLGPTRAAQAGLLTPRALKRGLLVVLSLSLLVGAYLAAAAGPVVIAIGVASILAAVAYTGGPWPLGYNGLGDAFVFLFFGLVAVLGTAFVQLGEVPDIAAWAAIPVGSLATMILVVNNVRDRETDLRAGKRTLPARFGRRFGLLEYRALLGAAHLVPVGLAATGLPLAALPLLTLPAGLRLARAIEAEEGRALNPRLGETARLLFLHSALFAAGIAAGRVLG